MLENENYWDKNNPRKGEVTVNILSRFQHHKQGTLITDERNHTIKNRKMEYTHRKKFQNEETESSFREHENGKRKKVAEKYRK